MTTDTFIAETAALAPCLSDIRRDFHLHAESGWTEMRTASLIARKLKDLGYEVLTGRAVCDADARMGVPDDTVLNAAYERAKAEGADPEFLEETKGGFTGVIGIILGEQPGPVIGMRFDIDALGVAECTADPIFLPPQALSAGMTALCTHAVTTDTPPSVWALPRF